MSIRSSLWTGRIPSLIESLGADLIEEPRINRQGVMFRETKEYRRHHFCQKTHGVQRSFHCGLARYLQIFPAKVCFNLQHVFPAIVLKLFHLSLSFDAFPESHRSFEYPYGFCSNSVSELHSFDVWCIVNLEAINSRVVVLFGTFWSTQIWVSTLTSN